MTELKQIYKCAHCGIVVEVLHAGGGAMQCCGEPMQVFAEKTGEAEGKEKHVPVIEKTDTGFIVKVGSVPHPMEEKHYIEWIEVCNTNGVTVKKFLKPGDVPHMVCDCDCTIATVRAYCNVHGLWKTAIA